jgi:hypothetical protein
MTSILDRDDQSSSVLAQIANSANRALRADDPAGLMRLVRRLTDRSRSLPSGAGNLRKVCVSIATDLYVWSGWADAHDYLLGYLANIGDSPEEPMEIAHRIRSPLGVNDLAVRSRAVGLSAELVRSSDSAFGDAWEAIRLQRQAGDESPDLALAKALGQTLDTVGRELYFASGAYEVGKEDPEPVPNAQEFYEAVAPLLALLVSVPLAGVIQHAIQVLDYLSPTNPRLAFISIGQAIETGRAAGYEFDILAAPLVVGIVERYLAQHRGLLQKDADCRAALIGILDAFVAAGWPEAARLTFGLQEIFR